MLTDMFFLLSQCISFLELKKERKGERKERKKKEGRKRKERKQLFEGMDRAWNLEDLKSNPALEFTS